MADNSLWTIPMMAQSAGGAAPVNPLDLMSKFMTIQQQQAAIRQQNNQNALFQQEFQAKRLAGQIIAASPDPDAAMTALTKHPQTAAFAGPIINSMRQAALEQQKLVSEKVATDNARLMGQKHQQEIAFADAHNPLLLANQQQDLTNKQQDFETKKLAIAKTGQEMGLAQEGSNRNGLEGFMKSVIPTLATNPERSGEMINMWLSGLSPATQKVVGPAAMIYAKSMLSELPDDPEERKSVLAKRSIGNIVSSGLSPTALFGTPETIDLGDKKLNVTKSPFGQTVDQTTGQLITSMSVGLPPIREKAAGGGMVVYPPVAGGQSQGLTTAPPSAVDSPVAGDGKPLIPSSDAIRSPLLRFDAAGQKNLGAGTEKLDDEFYKKFNDTGAKQYDMAQQSLGQLATMRRSFEELNRDGGMTTTGTLGEFRNSLVKMGSTLEDVFNIKGAKPDSIVGDESKFSRLGKVAAAEALDKEQRRLTLMVTNQFFGGSREAASIVQGISNSVPGLSTSYLGSKLIVNGLEAGAQRIIDERKFVTRWISENGGDTSNAIVKFNELHPMTDYMNRAYQKFGEEALRHGVEKKMMTKAEAQKLFDEKFSKPLVDKGAP